MDTNILKLIRRRFLELLFWEIFLSVIVTALSKADGELNENILGAASIWSVVIYAFINMFQQRKCCFELIDKKLYYRINYFAYCMFIILSMLLSVFSHTSWYMWFFSITGFVSYIYELMPVEISAIIFHIIMLVNIFVSVLGMEQALRSLKNNIIREEDDY